ncbi:MAG: hypothetical protein GY906_10170 [bacterium]|nr:hypothetical protein [bacterium]
MTTFRNALDDPDETQLGMRVDIIDGKHANQVPYRDLTLVGEGVPEISRVTPTAPAVEIVAGNLPMTVKAILRDGVDSPAAFHGRGTAGPNHSMFSGSFIWTSDSRFGDIIRDRLGIVWDLASDEPLKHAVTGPVSLHNRYELDTPPPFGNNHYLENAAAQYHQTGDMSMKQLREALFDIAANKASYGDTVSLVTNLAQALIESDYADDRVVG